jgi:hypothetical protein
MTPEVLVAVLSFAGTVVGSIVGILTAQKLTAYRLEQLEKKVEKHNNVFERTALLERDVGSLRERTDKLETAVLEL